MKSLALILMCAGASSADEKQVDDYLRETVADQPTVGTEIGIHDHDADLEDFSPASIARQVASLHKWQSAVVGQDIDSEAFRGDIRSRLVELEDVQTWKHRPDIYSGLASRTIYAIIKRNYAPLDQRLKFAIAREQKIPAMIAGGQKSLTEVAKISVEIAASDLPGIISFFEKDVPLAFAPVKDAALQKKFRQTNAGVIKALRDYEQFLKQLAPKANGSFVLGEALYRKKLAADEMTETPIDELLTLGEAELKRLQGEFIAVARRIDPKKTAEQVHEELARDHPKPNELIAETQARLAGYRKFLVDKQLVTLPSEVMPIVQETPPFMRAVTFASMDTPGAFEKSKEAYYNLTLPDPKWSPDQVEDFLRGFSRPLIDVVSIHEAFPGHYTQFLWMPKMHSKLRQFVGVSSNAEGWAHYCEQMMLDEGYGAGDPKLKLAQVQDALLRAARFIVGIRLHTRNMSLEQARQFFVEEGHQSKKVAEMETRRGTQDPTYLVYTLGKLEILKLRDDYKKKLGKDYSLRKFHDAFLAEGALPLPLVRRVLLK